MTTAKALPENIKDLTNKPAAKAIDDKYTVEILQEKLKAGGVRYLSADTKATLVWRFMDMEGMDFDAKIDDETAKQGDAKPDDAKANESVNEPKENDSQNLQDGHNVIQSATDVSVDDTDMDNAHSGAGADATNNSPANALGVAPNDVKTSDNDNAKPNDIKTNDDAPAPIQSNSVGRTPPKADDDDYVTVKHVGAFNFYETATGTMVRAGETTKIKTTYQASKGRILQNINQYNSTRGNFLIVE